MEYLKLGTIIKTRGLNGNVKVFSTSDFSDKRYQIGNKVYLRNNQNNQIVEMEILSYSNDNKYAYLTFKEYENIDAIKPFLKNDILIIKEENPLPTGVYYHADLIGCVLIEEQNEIGYVIDVEEYSAYKSLRVKFKNGKVFLLPFIETFIKKVDIKNKRIEVKLIAGMKE